METRITSKRLTAINEIVNFPLSLSARLILPASDWLEPLIHHTQCIYLAQFLCVIASAHGLRKRPFSVFSFTSPCDRNLAHSLSLSSQIIICYLFAVFEQWMKAVFGRAAVLFVTCAPFHTYRHCALLFKFDINLYVLNLRWFTDRSRCIFSRFCCSSRTSMQQRWVLAFPWMRWNK